MTYKIIQGNNIDVLKTYPDNHFDSIVTDPPYGIDFLGKDWDVNTGELETYQECLRVLKPGGHILAFSAARTYHHLAMTLERAGFEIRDQIMWIYSSGFPKSQDVGKSIQRSMGVKEKKAYKNNMPRNGGSQTTEAYEMCEGETICTDPEAKQWAGWGTQLKPAHEPIALARKPIKQSIAKNVQEHGTGALNIDATRVETTDKIVSSMSKAVHANLNAEKNTDKGLDIADKKEWVMSDKGRFPSNVLGEITDYQKYFYCPKVSRKERHLGHDLSTIPTNPEGIWNVDGTGVQYNAQKNKESGNNHPTVKPIALMEYLIKLITPPNGTVLDPFNGSGSTGCAAAGLGFNYVGIELDPNYVAISEKRIAEWIKPEEPENKFNDIFEE